MQKLYVNNYNVVTPNFRGFNFAHQMYEYMPDNLGHELTPEMIEFEYEIFTKYCCEHLTDMVKSGTMVIYTTEKP